MQNAHETKFLLPTHLSALTLMTKTWESSLSVAKEKTFLAPSSMMAFLGEKDARGLADAVGAEGVPPDLLGVAAADGVVLALVGRAVGGGRPGVDGVELDVAVLQHDTGDGMADTPEGVG